MRINIWLLTPRSATYQFLGSLSAAWLTLTFSSAIATSFSTVTFCSETPKKWEPANPRTRQCPMRANDVLYFLGNFRIGGKAPDVSMVGRFDAGESSLCLLEAMRDAARAEASPFFPRCALPRLDAAWPRLGRSRGFCSAAALLRDTVG